MKRCGSARALSVAVMYPHMWLTWGCGLMSSLPLVLLLLFVQPGIKIFLPFLGFEPLCVHVDLSVLTASLWGPVGLSRMLYEEASATQCTQGSARADSSYPRNLLFSLSTRFVS